jgi:hypothetical protein
MEVNPNGKSLNFLPVLGGPDVFQSISAGEEDSKKESSLTTFHTFKQRFSCPIYPCGLLHYTLKTIHKSLGRIKFNLFGGAISVAL